MEEVMMSLQELSAQMGISIPNANLGILRSDT